MASGNDEALLWVDYVVIAIYFVIVIGTGLWASFRAKQNSVSGFFLAGRSMNWILIGASIFSTNMGAPIFLGVAGSAAASGLAVVMFEWHAMWMLLLLGWVFLPVYIACGCYTLPQYMKLRFGGQRIRIWLAVISTLLTMIVQISGQLYAAAVFMQQIFHWNLYTMVTLILVVTAIFTILGGLTAVMWTDTIQTVILIAGAFTVSVITLIHVGGFERMREQFLGAAANYTHLDQALYGNHSCGFPPNNSFNIFRPPDDPNFPWPGMVFGLTVMALYAWCTDQLTVQRTLAAKNLTHAKAGMILAAYLKTLSFMFFVIPGMISRVLYPDEVACADPDSCEKICGNRNGCYDIAYPLLVLRVLPTGIRGIMMAALLSALVSSLTSMFNSSSSVLAVDLWPRCRPRASQREMMVVGRLWVVLMVGLGIAWLPLLHLVKGSQFWNYVQSVWSFVVPPIVMAYLFGMFWKRTTEQGAFWGMMAGFVAGVIRIGLEWSRVGVPCGSDEPDQRFRIVTQVHYLHVAIILSAVTSIVIVVVSLLTKPQPVSKLSRVTWWTKNSVDLPELSEDELEEDDEEDEHATKDGLQRASESSQRNRGKLFRAKYCAMKWLCGVDLLERNPQLTKEQIHELQMAATSIKQDPFWKRIVDVNGIICFGCCCFLHGFWA